MRPNRFNNAGRIGRPPVPQELPRIPPTLIGVVSDGLRILPPARRMAQEERARVENNRGPAMILNYGSDPSLSSAPRPWRFASNAPILAAQVDAMLAEIHRLFPELMNLRERPDTIAVVKGPKEPHPDTGKVVKTPRMQRSLLGILVEDTRRADGGVDRKTLQIDVEY